MYPTGSKGSRRKVIAGRSRRARARVGLAATLALSFIAGACSSGSGTLQAFSPGWMAPTSSPTWTPAPTATPWPTFQPTFEPIEWPSIEPAPSDTPEPTPRPLPTFKTRSGKLDTVIGTAAPAAPAKDGGKRAAQSINEFSFDMLRRLDQTGNLCFSPTSIEVALAMARPGARGQTATEMDAVMRDFGADDRAGDIVALLRALAADNFVDDLWDESGPVTTQIARLDIANGAFLLRGLPVEQPYLDALSSRFSSPVYLLDYARDPEGSRAAINNWIYDHTQGLIPSALQPGDVGTADLFHLTNAMYLKAKWQDEFFDGATAAKPFTRLNGSKVSVPTMEGGGTWLYASGPGWRAVDVPYLHGLQDGMTMTIVIPDDMAAYTANLSPATMPSQWKTYHVSLFLPKFKTRSHVELAPVLATMGMPTAFGPGADFSGITQAGPVVLDNVVHEAVIEVDEHGTVAAAVTDIGGKGGIGDSIPSVSLHVDKPFLYFIHDNATGAILFAGRIVDPSLTGSDD